MTRDPHPTASPTREGASLRTIHAAGSAGLIFAVLMTASLLLVRVEPPDAVSGFRAWWAEVSGRYLLGLYLVPFAGIAFMWFLAVVRLRIGKAEDQFFATVFLATGLLFIAMFFAAGATASAAATSTALTEEDRASVTFRFARDLGRAFFFVFAIKMAAAFMLVTSTIGRRTRVLPGWFIVVGLIAGVGLLVSVSFFEPLALIFPAWVAVLSVLLLRARADDWEHLRTPRDTPPL